LVTDCHSVLVADCHSILVTDCHSVLVTDCHSVLVTDCHSVLVTDYHSVLVTDCHSVLVTDCHSILAGWRNHFSQLLNRHGVDDVRQTDAYSRKTSVPEASAFEFEMAIVKLIRRKSPGTDQIAAEMIKAGV